jgi:hypothetical protein
MPGPAVEMISKWEHGVRAPEPEYRAALARIAKKQKATADLEMIFLASIIMWRVVARVESLHGRPV